MTGRWIYTYSGHAFPLENPQPSDFKLIDIAHHLSRINRYTGAIHLEHYSVAEHSARVAVYLMELCIRYGLVSSQLERMQAFRTGLFHDRHEAYLNDLNAPLKGVKGLEAYGELCDRYDDITAARFGVRGYFHRVDLVREADVSVFDLERPNVLRPGSPSMPPLGLLPKLDSSQLFDGWDDWGWRPNDAKERFLELARKVGVRE